MMTKTVKIWHAIEAVLLVIVAGLIIFLGIRDYQKMETAKAGMDPISFREASRISKEVREAQINRNPQLYWTNEKKSQEADKNLANEATKSTNYAETRNRGSN